MDLTPGRFPYLFRGKAISINRVELFLNFKDIHDTQIYSHDGTPLGDYAAAKPLKLSLTPPGGNAVAMQLKSDKSLLNGLPHATADLSDQSVGLALDNRLAKRGSRWTPSVITVRRRRRQDLPLEV